MSTTKCEKKAVKRKHAEDSMTAPATLAQTKRRTVVTPWRDTNEFNAAYDWLFSKTSTPATCRKALSQIRIWNLRRGSLCPASVLATGVVVQAQLEDKEGSTNIKTTYASAFTRFFNFMSSIMQGYNMTSMYETAKQLGLQSFIVDLRHLCAHGQELPPAEVLRHTAEHCLEWLRTFYWLPQREMMTDLDASRLKRKDKAQFEIEINRILKMYDLALECQLKGAHKLKAIKKLKPSADFNKLRLYCSAKKLKCTEEILGSLTNELGAAVKRESSSMKDLLDIYVSSILKMKYFLNAGVIHIEDEELVIQATQNLFRLLAMQGYIDNVFLAFVQLTEDANADDKTRTGASYWASKILKTFTMISRMKRMYQEELDMNPKWKPVDFSTLNKPEISKIMRKLLVHSGVDISLTLVFGVSPKKPRSWVFDEEFFQHRLNALNSYSVRILNSLLPLADPTLTTMQVDSITKLFDIKSEQITEENLPIAKNKQICRDNESNNRTFGIWTLEKDKNWSTCALGVIPSDNHNTDANTIL